MTQNITERIEAFLSEQGIANIATVDGERPHVAAMEYVTRGMELYFVSLPSTLKVRNIKTNPAVAITINGPGRNREEITGIQYFGQASRIDEPDLQENIKTWFFDKYLLSPSAHWFSAKMVYYAVKPDRIDLIDYAQGFGHKDTWTAES